MRKEGDAWGRNEALHLFNRSFIYSVSSQPPGGPADPTQCTWELKDRTDAWTSLENKKKQKALWPDRIGGVSPFSIPSDTQDRLRNIATVSWVG